MTPPTAISAIASIHVQSGLAYHTVALYMCTIASVHTHEGSASTHPLSPEPDHSGSTLLGKPQELKPQPRNAPKALHPYALRRKTHATVLNAPPTPGYSPHHAFTQRSWRHSFAPALAQVLTDM